jgi:dolichol-phosphate mannosyltransferase
MTENTNPVAEMTQNNQKNFSNVLLMIPTLNEEEAIASLIIESRECGFTNVLVVDGFSTDRTREVAAKASALVIEQDFGRGKGCGVRTGMKMFLQDGTDLLCIIDGDGTNVPSYLREMISIVQTHGAEIVLGSRTRGPRDPKAMNLLTLASNLTVSFLLGAKFGRFFTDIQTGYWVFSRKAVQSIYPKIRSKGFEVELEIFAMILTDGLRVCEVPVGYRRRKGKTKFSFIFRLRNLYYAFKFLLL